jgi:integrase
MASVFKPKGAAKYVIFYTDENGRRRKKTGSTDKAVTERVARDIENKVLLRQEGLIDEDAERFTAHARQPITKHLADFITSMEFNRRDAKHIRSTRSYIARIIEKARAERLADLTLSAVQRAIGGIAKNLRLSARSINAHTIAVQSFLNWAQGDHRIRAHDLGGIDLQNEAGDRRYVRRPLTEVELRTLITTTRGAPPGRKMSGTDRSVFYLVGAATGFRRTELGTLRPVDFDLAGPMPVVRLDGSRTKNGQPAEQPLPPSLAAELQPWLAAKPPGSPVFALPKKTALMLHADLKRCGIEPVDAQGRVVDCHSLRHAYISALARGGASLKVVQTLARHSDPKLTMNVYAHLEAFDLHGAVADALPDLTAKPGPNTLAATGTEGPYATVGATAVKIDDSNCLTPQALVSNARLSGTQLPRDRQDRSLARDVDDPDLLRLGPAASFHDDQVPMIRAGGPDRGE